MKLNRLFVALAGHWLKLVTCVVIGLAQAVNRTTSSAENPKRQRVSTERLAGLEEVAEIVEMVKAGVMEN